MDNDKSQAYERLRQTLLFGRFAGPIMQASIKAELRGIQAHQEGLNYNANPYDDAAGRIAWIDGMSWHNNMRYPTMPGKVGRIPRPPRGHVV